MRWWPRFRSKEPKEGNELFTLRLGNEALAQENKKLASQVAVHAERIAALEAVLPLSWHPENLRIIANPHGYFIAIPTRLWAIKTSTECTDPRYNVSLPMGLGDRVGVSLNTVTDRPRPREYLDGFGGYVVKPLASDLVSKKSP